MSRSSFIALIRFKFLVSALLLAGCSSSDAPTPEKEAALKEIPTTDAALSGDATEPELMFRGKRYFESQIYGEAKKAFQSITSNYPLGPYAEFAAVKYADSVFELADYPAAASLYEELSKNYPASEFAPYTLFRAARSHQLSQRGVGRDESALNKSVKLYQELLSKFPDSMFAGAGKGYLREAQENLADYERSVAEFYAKRGKENAALARQAEYNKKWEPVLSAKIDSSPDQGTTNAELQRIAATLPPVAPPSAAANPKAASGITGAPSISLSKTDQTGEGSSLDRSFTHQVTRIDCLNAPFPQIVLQMDRQVGEDVPLRFERVSGQSENVYELAIPETGARSPFEKDCPEGVRVTFSKDGRLRVFSGTQPSALTLGNPSRIIVLFNQ
jgi:outer membrane protein assembly factor BamD